MAVQVRSGAAWRSIPLNRVMYVRIGGVWKPILDMWIKGTPKEGAPAVPAGTLMEPFDNLTAWTVTGTPTIVAGGRNGNCVQFNLAGSVLTQSYTGAAESDTITMGFAYKVADLSVDRIILHLRGDNTATLHNTLAVSAAGALTMHRGPSPSNIIATSAAGAITVNTWYYIEFQIKLHDTTGFVTLRINGAQVAAVTNVDTKNVGADPVYDTVRITGLAAINSFYDDLYLTLGPTGVLLGSINANSPPSSLPTSADSIWHKVTDYSVPGPATPTNFRVTSGGGDHHSISVAWDYTIPAGGVEPIDFVVQILYNDQPWRNDVAPAGARTWTCADIPQNTYFKLKVLARYYYGRTDSAWSNQVNWYVGYDAYWVTNGTANYGWGGDEHYKPYSYSVSTAANNDFNSWGGQWMFDDNWGDNSRWNSGIVDPALNSYQGEGYRVWLPRDQNWKVRGIVSWNWRHAHTIWVGYSHDNYTWQGGPGPAYIGSNGFLRHNYVYGRANSGTWDANATLYCLDYPIYNQPQPVIDVLYQVPGSDDYNYRISVVEMRVIVNKWMVLSYSDRLEPARNSGAY